MRFRTSQFVLLTAVVSIACCLTLLAGGCAARGPASTAIVSGSFADLTDAELADKADVVLVGTVVAQPQSEKGRAVGTAARQRMRAKGLSEEEIAQMAESEAETVYTLVQVAPSEVLKGDIGQGNLKIRVLGGQDEGLTVVAEDFPTFTKGETVLLFLGREYDGDLGPLAVYRIDGSKAESRDLGNNRKTDLSSLKKTIREAAGQ
jgi:hypothetical protein